MAGYDRGETEGADSDQEYDHKQNLPHQKQAQHIYHSEGNDLIRRPSQEYFSDSVAYTTCTEDKQYQEQQYGDESQHEYQSGGKYPPPGYQHHQNDVGLNGGISKNGVYQNGGPHQYYGPVGDTANGNRYFIDQNRRETYQLQKQQQQVSRHVDGTSMPRQVQYRGDGADNLPQDGALQQNSTALHQNGTALHQQHDGLDDMHSPQGLDIGMGQNVPVDLVPGNAALQQGNAISGNAQQQFLQAGQYSFCSIHSIFNRIVLWFIQLVIELYWKSFCGEVDCFLDQLLMVNS